MSLNFNKVAFVRSASDRSHFLRDGLPQFAFAGRSNVGKSSMINSLLGNSKLARTSSEPGKTRLVNFFQVNERFWLVDLPGYGFALRMSCIERSPRAIYTGYNEPVYTDSCLEFFAAWAEGSPTRDRRYMNMEMNARGTLLSCLGTDRHARVPVRDITGGSIPDVRGEILPDRWSVTAGIPATLLGKVYGSDPAVFTPGYSFRGNFYKCGDETAVPHYGMWNPVCTDKPDFHRPEYFGDFVIDCP